MPIKYMKKQNYKKSGMENVHKKRNKIISFNNITWDADVSRSK